MVLVNAPRVTSDAELTANCRDLDLPPNNDNRCPLMFVG
jgi:hypothetical protein